MYFLILTEIFIIQFLFKKSLKKYCRKVEYNQKSTPKFKNPVESFRSPLSQNCKILADLRSCILKRLKNIYTENSTNKLH